MSALGLDQRRVGQRVALPTVVPVHGGVAAGDGGDRDHGGRGLEGAQKLERGTGRGVAAVQEGMDRDRHAGRLDDLGEFGDLRMVRVHAAGRQEAHDVRRAARVPEPRDEARERRLAREFAAFDGRIDARQVLGHDAPGAQVHVTDLGVAHLARRQADLPRRGVEQRVRAGAGEPVEHRRPGQADRVVLAGLPVAPAVQDAKHHGARSAVLIHGPLYRTFAPAPTGLLPRSPGRFRVGKRRSGIRRCIG